MTMTFLRAGAFALGTVLTVGGCAQQGADSDALKAAEAKNQQLEDDLLAARLERAKALEEKAAAEKRLAAAGSTQPMMPADPNAADLPPNAAPGECYARVLVPPKYEMDTETVTVREASERIELEDARYQWVEERVKVKEAWEEVVEVTPAQYEWAEEKVLIEDASFELKTVPAEFKTVEEQILVRPAYTTWKKGRGPIEKIDSSTGEIMCLVEVPAEYETIKKTVLVAPERTVKTKIPAKYNTVKRRVMVKEPQVRKVTHPAEYKTVKVRKLVNEPKEIRIPVPAEYKTVERRKLVTPASLNWREILCETNTTTDVVRKLQVALKERGFNPGPIDGVYGPLTQGAVTRYQRANNMATGGLTLATLESLGVDTRTGAAAI